MLQVRKSNFCVIPAIFFQCCSRSEAQVLLAILDFSGFPLGIISWKRTSLFNGRGLFFKQEGGSFLGGRVPHGDISFDGGGVNKITG